MRHQWLPAAILAGVVTLIAACQAGSATPQGGRTAASAQDTPDTTTRPAPSTPTNDQGQPTRVPDRTVRVTVSAERYAPGAVISAVVANGLDRTIFTNDSKSDCSIVMLQRLRATTWEDVPGCAQQRPPATVAIGPAHARTVSMHPTSSNFRISLGSEPTLSAGMYRAKYTYRFTPEQDNNDVMAALSGPFTID